MKQSFLYNSPTIVIVICLLAVMTIFYFWGLRTKTKKNKKAAGHEDEGLGAIEGSLLGLLALLLSFTFSMSSSRHDHRFSVMVEEANSIGTAILRADLFPDSERTVFRNYFSRYVDARIAQYDAKNNEEKNQKAAAETEKYSKAIWQQAIAATKSDAISEINRGTLMITSLNDMIDAVTTRKASRETTVPESILYLLFMLCLASAFIVGYGSKKKPDTVVAAGFAVMIGITIFSILDLDRPHRGLIKLDKAEQNIIDLKDLLK